MATFNFDEYQKQQAARKAAKDSSGNGGERKPVHFMKEFLNASGDQVVVRFPYTGVNDLKFETVHKVVGVFPGDKFGKSVRCTGDDKCPLCNSEDENIRKRKSMFYATMVVYKPNGANVDLCATVWERPAAFADSDLKNLITEYGDLSDYLFKITRNGSGTDTRYTILPVNMNSPVYSTAAYGKDFSCLEGIDATRILAKTVEQYNAALHPEQASAQEQIAPEINPQAEVNNLDPFTKTAETVEEVPVTKEETVTTTAPTPTVTTTSTGTTRYKF